MPRGAAEFTEVDPELYDALIDWPKRLGHETPLLREAIDRTAARRVLDAACGSGRHAELIHSWGLETVGADASPAMIAHCRRRYAGRSGLEFIERRFDEHPAPGDTGRFDVVLCLGNSLALTESAPEVERSVTAMLEWLRPGGILIVQVLNLWALPEGKTMWQKCLRTKVRGEPLILLKGVHRSAGRGYVDLIELDEADPTLRPRYGQAVFCGIEPEWLTRAVAQRGAAIDLFGSYRKEAYSRDSSADLIALITSR